MPERVRAPSSVGRSPRDSRYRAMARKLARAIEGGILPPGARLPSIRQLRQREQVSASTVIQALGELESLGLIESRPRSGYYVRPLLLLAPPARPQVRCRATAVGVAELVARVYQAARDPSLVVLSLATPSLEFFPVTSLARSLSAEARRSPRGAVEYELPPGLPALRAALSRRALTLGCLLSPEDLVVTGGVTEAITLGLLAVTSRGDTVAVETPAYYGTLLAIEALGLKALPIPCDPAAGLDLDELGRQLERQRIAAVVAVPNFANPLGSCMPDAAKERLVRMLAARRVPLIEDDVYGDLAFADGRPRPAKSWDADGNVIYCGSFTKSLGPGFRIGFAAPGRHRERFEVLKFALNVAVPSITQRALASYLGGGGYGRHLRALRARLRANVLRMSAAVAESFPAGTRVSRPQGGCFLWVDLPAGVDALALHARALEAGISIAPGPIFSPTQAHRSSIRLSCGDPWSERIASAVRLVGRLAALPERSAEEAARPRGRSAAPSGGAIHGM